MMGSGQLIMEFDGSTGTLKKEYVNGGGMEATIDSTNGTQYTTTDTLGSPRVVTSSSGGVVSRHDFMPFGEELGVSIGGRTSGMGFGAADGVQQKFTQKERDNETGLDYFLARYLSSTQGRFTSPDEFKGGPDELFEEAAASNPTFYADLTDPQSLNKYQYSYNNPLRYVDPDGHQGKETVNNILSYGGQVIKDTAIGGGKGVANAAAGVPNTINLVINTAISPFTDARVPYVPTFQADTPGERGAMFAVQVIALVEGARGANATGAAMVDSSRTAAMTQEMRASTSSEVTSTLQPGPYAADSIPARGPQRNFTPPERAAGNAIGEKSGCHNCGAKTPGTKSGNWVLDHQPPTGVNVNNAAQRLYPQCLACSQRQGGDVTAWKRGLPSSRQ